MYRNVVSYTENGQDYVWETTWNEKGERIELVTPVNPYLYFEDKNATSSKDKSIFGRPLRFLDWNSSFERKKWIEENKDIMLFDKFSTTKQYLLDKYWKCDVTSHEFSQYPLRIFFFDIEVEIQDEFPEADMALYPINVISIYDTLTSKVYVWAYKSDVDKHISEQDKIEVTKSINKEFEEVPIEIYTFDNEKKMLRSFISFWTSNYPDVISGWNIDGFDVNYIINRLNRVLSLTDKTLEPALLLSPVSKIDNKSLRKRIIVEKAEAQLKRQVIKKKILGISILDYMNVYKKFLSKSRQSWKLDSIAKEDLGKGKLDYYDLGYESLKDFMRRDFKTFVKYNIIDTILVKELDDERKFMKLLRTICNIGLVDYESIMRTTPYVLGALCVESRKRGMRFLTDTNRSKEVKSEGYEGAFVFPTAKGYYENGIMSFDFNSLYPNCIMTVNISPETYIGKVEHSIGDDDPDNIYITLASGKLVKKSNEDFQKLLDTKLAIAGNGSLFKKSNVQWGIMPSFCDWLYKNRVKVKSEMKKNKQLKKKVSEEIATLEAQLKSLG